MTAVRVLLLFSSSELGGAERSLTRMALLPSEVDYRLATLDGEGEWCAWVRGMGREPVIFGERRRSGDHGAFGWNALAALRRYVRRERVDVIYVCGLRAAGILRFLKATMDGVRIVHGVRTNPDSDSRLDVGLRFIERWSHGLVDGYITNSQIAAETLGSRCGIPTRRMHVIHNGLAGMPEAVPALSGRPMEVLTVANLLPVKGHREYLNAVRLVLNAVPNARFVFVGRDDMNGAVQRAVEAARLSDAVDCVGFQTDVSQYFRRSRVFALPSFNEGCPTAILESFAWGCPVVAYGTGGIPELIDDGRDGFIVPPQDVHQLATQIVRLLRDVSLSETLGLAGRTKVATQHTLASSAKSHETTLTQIAAGAR